MDVVKNILLIPVLILAISIISLITLMMYLSPEFERQLIQDIWYSHRQGVYYGETN